MPNYLMLACHNIKPELLAALAEAPVCIPVIFIPRGLHLVAEKMRAYLNEIVGHLEYVDQVLLPMGRCGNGVLGLNSPKASLVLPKCADCLDLLLSDNRLPSSRPSEAYFLTGGWFGGPYSVDGEYRHSLAKYGPEKAARVMKMIYAHYRHFILINTGLYDLAGAAEILAPIAETTGLEIREAPGRFGVLRKMAKLDFDDDFVIVPPGVTVDESHFEL